jgi:hypothetical protein
MARNDDPEPLRRTKGQEDDGGPSLVPDTYVPSRRADVVELDMEDGLVLFDPRTSLVHHLNSTARVVWRLFDGTASIGILSDDVADELGLDRFEVERQVTTLVAQLEEMHLIEDGRTPSAGG